MGTVYVESSAEKRREQERQHEIEQERLRAQREEQERQHEIEQARLRAEREEHERQHEIEQERRRAKREEAAAEARRKKEAAQAEIEEAKAKAARDKTRLAQEHEQEMIRLQAADAAEREAAELKMLQENARLEKEALQLQKRLEKELIELKAQQDKERRESEQAEAEYWHKEIKKGKKQLKACQKNQAKTIVKLTTIEEDEKRLNKQLKLHATKYEEDITTIMKRIEAAQLQFKEAHDKIRDAIQKTNVDEGSITQFLNLINDGLVVSTLSDTVKREELNSKLGVFAELIERKTKTSMSIDTFFTGRLAPFVKYLKAQEFASMDDLLCDDEKDFNGIVEIVEKGINKENREIKRYNTKVDASNAKITQKNAEIDEKVAGIDEKIAAIEKKAYQLREDKAKENDWEKVQQTIAEIDQKIATIQKKIVELNAKEKKDGGKEEDEEKAKELKAHNAHEKEDGDKGKDITGIDQQIAMNEKTIVELNANKDGAKEENKEKTIGTLQKEMDELNAQKAKEQEDGAKGKKMADELSAQQEILRQKKQQKKDTLKDKKELGERRDPIAPIRTKKMKGGPLFQKLKKLCMRNLAEGKRGWISKRDDADTEVDIDIILKGKLAPFAKYLKDEGYDTMEDVLCDDAEDFDQIIDIIEAGIAEHQEAHRRPLNRGTSAKESLRFKSLKKMCLKEFAGDRGGWIAKQEQKKKIVTVQLNEISKPLATFFGKMDVAVTDARKYLEYSVEKTPAQRLAIQNAETNKNKLKAIEWKSRDEVPADEEEKGTPNDDEHQMAQFNAGRNNILAKNPEQLNHEQAGALDITRKENAAFVTAAVVKLHVVDELAPLFEGGKQPFTRQTGLTLARDVEDCSLQIMQSQAGIRSSLLIARQLVEFKPAKPGPKAAPFWEVIDTGIMNIFENYIEMIKIAATYFGYFVKFKSAFEHYVACHEIQKDDMDLVVATEYLQRDVKEFTAFKDKMQETVDKLTNEAKTVINDCVSKTSGAQSFAAAQAAREKASQNLLKEQNNLNERRFRLDEEYNEVQESWKKKFAEMGKVRFEKKQRDEKMKYLQEYIAKATEKRMKVPVADLQGVE